MGSRAMKPSVSSIRGRVRTSSRDRRADRTQKNSDGLIAHRSSCPRCSLSHHTHGRIEPDAHHRSRRQLDVLAVSRRDCAAGANRRTEDCALHAADNAADDAADAGADTGGAGLPTNTLTFEYLRGSRTHVLVASAYADAIES